MAQPVKLLRYVAQGFSALDDAVCHWLPPASIGQPVWLTDEVTNVVAIPTLVWQGVKRLTVVVGSVNDEDW